MGAMLRPEDVETKNSPPKVDAQEPPMHLRKISIFMMILHFLLFGIHLVATPGASFVFKTSKKTSKTVTRTLTTTFCGFFEAPLDPFGAPSLPPRVSLKALSGAPGDSSFLSRAACDNLPFYHTHFASGFCCQLSPLDPFGAPTQPSCVYSGARSGARGLLNSLQYRM